MKANLSPKTLADFWRWFEANEDELFHLNQNSYDLFDRLSEAMHRVDKNLTFEFSPVLNNGSREFIISAAGNKSSFCSITALYSTAPVNNRWSFIRFRQRRDLNNDLKIQYSSHLVKVSEVHYAIFKDRKPGKVGLMLFLDGYSVKDRDTWDQIGYLLIDSALGEYDAETHVGEILFLSRESEYFRKARPLAELPSHFDKMLGRA
ncbi:MAG: hypothetical protein ACOYM3_26520 [Terrimicrobiaceae bacterium]